MSFQEYTIKDYNRELGEKKSTPGGGSVLGVTLQLACNLNKMVINFTLGKKGYEKIQDRLIVLNKENDILENNASRLADEDASTFKELMASFKTGDRETIENAAKKSAEVPYNLYMTAEKVEDIASELMTIANKNVVSDAMIARDLCLAVYPGCKANIESNLTSVSDEEFINRMRSI